VVLAEAVKSTISLSGVSAVLHIDPVPIHSDTERPQLPWTTGKRLGILQSRLSPEISLAETLNHRRTQRSLQPVPLKEIAQTLSIAGGVRFTKVDDQFCRSRRPSIAAGAIHAVEIFFIHGQTKRIFYFDPFEPSISAVRCKDTKLLERLWSRATMVSPEAKSTLIVLIGRPQILGLAYTAAESLLWRDAGALLQTLSMTAYGRGLGLCPVGLLGHELIDCITTNGESLFAVGTAWLGSIK
jgi:hypothetical protein